MEQKKKKKKNQRKPKRPGGKIISRGNFKEKSNEMFLFFLVFFLESIPEVFHEMWSIQKFHLTKGANKGRNKTLTLASWLCVSVCFMFRVVGPVPLKMSALAAPL